MAAGAGYDYLYVPVLACSIWLLVRGWLCWRLARGCGCETGRFAQYYVAAVIGIGAAELVLSLVMVLAGYGTGSHIARFWAGFDLAASMALLLPLNYLHAQLSRAHGETVSD